MCDDRARSVWVMCCILYDVLQCAKLIVANVCIHNLKGYTYTYVLNWVCH